MCSRLPVDCILPSPAIHFSEEKRRQFRAHHYARNTRLAKENRKKAQQKVASNKVKSSAYVAAAIERVQKKKRKHLILTVQNNRI